MRQIAALDGKTLSPYPEGNVAMLGNLAALKMPINLFTDQKSFVVAKINDRPNLGWIVKANC